MFFKGPFWDAYIQRGLSTEGNFRFKIDWASLIVGRKFTIFALFYFVFEGNFQVKAPRGGLYLEGWFNEEFFGLRVWGAYICRDLEGTWRRGGAYFRNFTVSFLDSRSASWAYFGVKARRILRKAQPKNPRRTWALCPPQNFFSVARRLGRGKNESARGTTGSSTALIAISEFAQQVGGRQDACVWQTWQGYYLRVSSWYSLNINVFWSLSKRSV